MFLVPCLIAVLLRLRLNHQQLYSLTWKVFGRQRVTMCFKKSCLTNIPISICRRQYDKNVNPKMEATRKQNTPNFLKKEYFLPPGTHKYLRINFGKIGELCFPVASVLKFDLLLYYWRPTIKKSCSEKYHNIRSNISIKGFILSKV